jgi:hypothetical protein
VLDTRSDLVGKLERRVSKPWITQEIFNKTDERKKWKNVNNVEGRTYTANIFPKKLLKGLQTSMSKYCCKKPFGHCRPYFVLWDCNKTFNARTT